MLVGRAMSSNKHQQVQFETPLCKATIFGDLTIACLTPHMDTAPRSVIQPVPVTFAFPNQFEDLDLKKKIKEDEKWKASHLVEELLEDIYNNNNNIRSNECLYSRKTSRSSDSCKSYIIETNKLHRKETSDLVHLVRYLERHIARAGTLLLRELKRRDALRRQQDAHCDVITGQLLKRSSLESGDMCFSIQPAPGESGFSQWATAMKMVAQLPGGIPPDFRKRLWIILAERHLAQKGVDWTAVEKNCFSEWSHPADSELGVQIVKDLHRTGCSLFCGADGQENQALLKRVLLAYARWNKAVGYCQGFNMLAALILQVTDKCETDALKLMIYLIEGVLPDSYFADSLRGLSVDMAVFRELLRARLPRLSKHLDTLQNAAKDGTTSYEPPLTNVFTMQWFLTLFCNCLPQPTVLRVWDLILLEGNEILLRTALAIWQTLAERILTVRTADEFYCMMGVLTHDLLDFNLIDANSLIKAVVAIGPLTELKSLREHYLYNINPWGSSIPANTERQLKIYPKENLVLDISALKKQYAKLKQRQRQAHIIFSAAISRQPPPSAPVAMNHLLLGKSALVPAKRLGPPKGSIPPVRLPPSTLHWKDAPKTASDSSSSSDTELCDDPSESSSSSPTEDLTVNTEPNTSQLLDDDNPETKSKDNIELKKNIVDVPEIEEEINQKPFLPNIFDTSSASSVKDDFMFNEPESDNDSEDFEHFLKDRVHYLKDIALPEESTSDIRVNCNRRNSERALQIIQENSLILHRILQCQSRLSPPPIVESEASEESRPSLILDSPTSNTNTIEAPDDDKNFTSLFEDKEQNKSPEYGSRYTKILEKSKNLDERYNSLILNAPVSNLTRDNLKKFTSASQEEDFSKCDLLFKLKDDDATSEFSLKSWERNDASGDAKLIDLESDCDRKFVDFIRDKPSGSLEVSDDLNFEIASSPASPVDCSVVNKSTELKSPNKIFNPFPVPLNSRQSKEVPLKLGLYKK